MPALVLPIALCVLAIAAFMSAVYVLGWLFEKKE